VTPVLFDGTRATLEVSSALRTATHLITTIAPDDDGDPVLRCCRTAIMDEMPALRWIGYLSTTGVYGDHGGGWVYETSPCWPASSRAIRRLAVEDEWREVAGQRGVPLATLRLSGIYGPGRNAIVSVADGTARLIRGTGHWFNRIHVADIAGATALLARMRASGTFNISDDEPAPPQHVILHAASLLGVKAPPEIDLNDPLVSPALRAFYAANRRVSNARIRELGYVFRYPDYRAGLDTMWQRNEWR
jgi:nucleoside-diphosphate-sugar epimerase